MMTTASMPAQQDYGKGPASRPRGQHLFRKPSDDPRHAIVEILASCDDAGAAVGDLADIDFTVREIAFDGQYVVAIGGDYLCIRFFQFMPGGLFVKQSGRFEKLSMGQLAQIEVHGLVNRVYRRD